MNSQKLYVFEYGGTARSGKGTMVSWLSEVHPEVATDETGADYRAVTLGLLQLQILEIGMGSNDVSQAVGRLGLAALTDLAARRKELETDNGKDALYASEVNGIVHYVSPLETVRKAVKDGFAQRVANVRDDNEHRILLVDGRNLGPVVERVEGTSLVMRTFVFCLASEAARRECLRAGLESSDPGWHDAFAKNYQAIINRNNTDKDRVLDPVVPDADAIEYWTNQDLIDATTGIYSHFLFNDDDATAVQGLFASHREYTDVPRLGAGLKAVAENRQIHFDTTSFATYDNSKHAMLLAANTMFEEALRARQILDRNGQV